MQTRGGASGYTRNTHVPMRLDDGFRPMSEQSYRRKNGCWHNIHEHESVSYTCTDCGNVAPTLKRHRQHECDPADDDGPDGETAGPDASNLFATMKAAAP